MFLFCNMWHVCVCARTTKEPTIAGHQGSVGGFIQRSAHEGKTGASMKHVEVDWPAPPQDFSDSGHHICEEEWSTVSWLPAIKTWESAQQRKLAEYFQSNLTPLSTSNLSVSLEATVLHIQTSCIYIVFAFTLHVWRFSPTCKMQCTMEIHSKQGKWTAFRQW